MKNSLEILKEADVTSCNNIIQYDLDTIDNPNLRNPNRITYLDRIAKCIKTVQERFPNPEGVTIGDFACAQGNIGLTLAELGYDVYAIDINPQFINYSKKKYQKGNIKWIVSDIFKVAIPFNSLDVAIAGELIEHCAYPEEVIDHILKYVRIGGYLIITTPNGAILGNHLPTFEKVLEKEKRKSFETKQFGPDAKDHLFLFKVEEIKFILSEKMEIEQIGYCGGTLLFNKYATLPMNLIPVNALTKISESVMTMPCLKSRLSRNIYAIIKKRY